MRIEHDAAGKVDGVVYVDADGKMQKQKARVVAVAGNSLESPRLLLNSHSSMFPDGLANSSGQVGRNYMRHMTGSVYAVFDKPVHMYRGTTMAGIIMDEARHDPKRGFSGGYEMETLSLGLPFMVAFLNPGAWGRSFTTAIDGYPNMAGMWLVGEDLPQETNRVTLDPVAKDANGMPVASVHYDDHPNDIAMRNHAYQQGAAVYDAVGATRTFPTPPLPQHPQPGDKSDERKAARRRRQQIWADARHQEPVRLGRQSVHDECCLQSDPDDCHACDPPSRLHRRGDAARRNLVYRKLSAVAALGPESASALTRPGSNFREDEMTDASHTASSPIAVARRAALSLGFAAVAGLAAAAVARAEAGGIKITALYGNPKNPEEFEKYYAGTHMPLVYDVKEIKRSELALGIPGPDGKPPPFYRITELYFDSAEQLKQAAETAQWKKVVEDVPKFASGGVTILLSKIA